VTAQLQFRGRLAVCRVRHLLNRSLMELLPAPLRHPPRPSSPSLPDMDFATDTVNEVFEAPPDSSFWMVGTTGQLYAYGSGIAYWGAPSVTPTLPIVGMVASPFGLGYWEVASDGGVFSFGSAAFYGSTGAIHLNKPIVGMAATPDGGGYWLVASDGGMFSFGDAPFHGSTGNITLNRPVVGMAATPDGGGYWLVASDGGIFAFGDAQFSGFSMPLKLQIVGMAAAS
jgi:hypothetical protein